MSINHALSAAQSGLLATTRPPTTPRRVRTKAAIAGLLHRLLFRTATKPPYHRKPYQPATAYDDLLEREPLLQPETVLRMFW